MINMGVDTTIHICKKFSDKIDTDVYSVYSFDFDKNYLLEDSINKRERFETNQYMHIDGHDEEGEGLKIKEDAYGILRYVSINALMESLNKAIDNTDKEYAHWDKKLLCAVLFFLRAIEIEKWSEDYIAVIYNS